MLPVEMTQLLPAKAWSMPPLLRQGAVVFAGLCLSISVQASKGPSANTEPSPASIVFQILASELALQQGEHGVALATYLSLAQRTNDAAVAERACRLALNGRAPRQALEAGVIWLKARPESAEAQDIVDSLQMLLGFHNDLRQTLLSRRAKALADGEAKLAAFYDRLAALSSKGPDPAKAVALLESVALEHSNRSELLYTRAMLYERSRNFEQMELLLRSLIAKEPDHAHALNALGYSFADRNERLPEAKVLIEQALRLQPNDPHILDSMGWVYFRKGRPKDALPFLYSAYERQPDAEISAHLGEVLWQLLRADEALAVFRLGLSHDPQNAVLRETLARLGIARKAVLSDPLTEALDPSGSP